MSSNNNSHYRNTMLSNTIGIAALLLPGGRTLHSRFNLPCDFDDFTLGDISRRSAVAELIREAKVIIWDEAPMAHRKVFECVDRTLRDVMDTDSKPFGGKTMVLSGDFRQVLPVIPRAARPQIVQACLNRTALWPQVEIHHLTINMRVRKKAKDGATVEEIKELKEFANILKQIGDGDFPVTKQIGPDTIKIPETWLSKSTNIQDFIEEAFPKLNVKCNDDDYLRGRAILTPKNVDALKINNEILKKLPSPDCDPIISVDQNLPDGRFNYAEETFHKLDPSSLPPHTLYLKKDAVIMLLRNLNPAEGACNGTRLKVIRFTQYVIEATILTGPKKGKKMFIPKIKLYANDKTSPIPFIRHQFPVKLAFAMTINKAQGQTLDFMALYLPDPVFSHGQLYVACGRVGSPRNLTIYIEPGQAQGCFNGHSGVYTRNVVFKEVFDDEWGMDNIFEDYEDFEHQDINPTDTEESDEYYNVFLDQDEQKMESENDDTTDEDIDIDDNIQRKNRERRKKLWAQKGEMDDSEFGSDSEF